MANVLGMDELNIAQTYSPTNKPMPYRQYFGEMDLDEDEIEERIAMARRLEDDAFKWVFGAIALASMLGTLDSEQFYVDSLYERYRDVVEDFGYGVENGYQRVDDYIYSASGVIIGNTFKRITNGVITNTYFTSDDRAMFCAEEETNSVEECAGFVNAVISGKRTKQWSAIIDKRTREHHRDYSGTAVPITEPFEILGELMMFPRDLSLGASSDNVTNCRCHAIYR